jgi:glucose dehydrogenase
MHTMKRHGTRGGIMAALALAVLLSVRSAPSAMERTASAASVAPSVPPGAPVEDVRYANQWPAPNGDLYNTRVAHATIASTNVSKLGIAWTIPLSSAGANGADVANPVIAAGIAYLQDGASDVMAVRYATGQVLGSLDYFRDYPR